MKPYQIFLHLLLIFCASLAQAFIPRGLLILDKTVENAGKGAYQIELEVQFPNGQENLSLKETWTVDNENNMRLVVTGLRDFRDRVLLSETIVAGNKQSSSGSTRISTEFLERYFHFRSVENLAQSLIQLKIAPAHLLNPKPILQKKAGDYQPEGFLRLSRSGGVINYAFGSAGEETDLPGIWIEQDQFLLRKLRLPSSVELVAEKYSQYGKGLQYPRARTVRWNSNVVQIQTLTVQTRNKDTSKPLKLENNLKLIAGQPAEALVQEFYQRFR